MSKIESLGSNYHTVKAGSREAVIHTFEINGISAGDVDMGRTGRLGGAFVGGWIGIYKGALAPCTCGSCDSCWWRM